MAEKTPTFVDLEVAKKFAAEQTAANPRARQVYRLEYTKDGQTVTKFIVAQSVPRAQNHAFAELRDAFGIKLGVAERKAGGFQPKSLEETVRSLSPEEIDRVKQMLAAMQPAQEPVPSGEPASEKKGRKSKAE